jgi:hypothetical protein
MWTEFLYYKSFLAVSIETEWYNLWDGDENTMKSSNIVSSLGDNGFQHQSKVKVKGKFVPVLN